MNELEFRAFHRGVMLHNCAVINGSLAIEENPKGDNLHVTDDGSHYYNDWAKYVIYPDSKLMQYTGLKDANGVKIFEGDIIQIGKTSRHILKVEFINAYVGGWVLIHKDPNKWLSLGAREDHELTVIGNDYETPELLTTEGSL